MYSISRCIPFKLQSAACQCCNAQGFTQQWMEPLTLGSILRFGPFRPP